MCDRSWEDRPSLGARGLPRVLRSVGRPRGQEVFLWNREGEVKSTHRLLPAPTTSPRKWTPDWSKKAEASRQIPSNFLRSKVIWLLILQVRGIVLVVVMQLKKLQRKPRINSAGSRWSLRFFSGLSLRLLKLLQNCEDHSYSYSAIYDLYHIYLISLLILLILLIYSVELGSTCLLLDLPVSNTDNWSTSKVNLTRF